MTEPIKRRDTKKALKKIDALAQKYIKEGMSKKDARDRAHKEARNNPRANIRHYRRARNG